MSEERKMSGYIPVSRDMLLDHGLVEPTPEEQRLQEAWRAEYAERKAAATAAWPDFVAALDAITDPVARAVLDLHKSRDGECAGCEFSGYEAEAPSWPCDTTATVATTLGIEVPKDLDLAEQHRNW